MASIALDEIGKRLDELAQRVEQGETIVVTRDGKPVLDLVPHATTSKRKGGLDLEGGRRFLAERGIERLVTFIAPDFDEPLPEDFLLQPLPKKAEGVRTS